MKHRIQTLSALALVLASYSAQAQKAVQEGEHFHFVNDKKEILSHLGTWDKAEGFASRSDLAKVEKEGRRYFLDTKGRTYLLAEKLEDIKAETQAVDLSKQLFNELPQELFQWTGLQILILQDCELTTISPKIAQLQNLEFFFAASNALQVLPDELFSLPKLRRLNLEKNQISQIPKSITAAKNLSYLNLWQNQVVQLPANIGELSELEALNLGSNRVQELPESISQLHKLERLYMDNNELRKLPESMSSMPKLRRIYLNGNDLEKIPDPGQWLNLELLWLNKNRLKTLPESIGNCIKLKELDLSNNLLKEVPESLQKLENLRELMLWQNQVRPEQVKALQMALPECNVEG